MEWYLKVITNYVGFSGRARRKEYWWFILFNLVISFLLGVVDGMLGLGTEDFGLLSSLYGLAVFLPGLAVSVRRLHDTGRSGWWVLINFVIIIGNLVYLYFMIKEGDAGENAYGADPKEGEAVVV